MYSTIEVAVSFTTLEDEIGSGYETVEDEFLFELKNALADALEDIETVEVGLSPWDSIDMWDADGNQVAPPQSIVQQVATAQRRALEEAKKAPLTIYIARDADYWGAEPADEDVARLVTLTEQVADEYTQLPVEVWVVNETFSAETHNGPAAAEIVEEAWRRMFG